MPEFQNCIPVDWSCDQEYADGLDPEVKVRAEALASMALQNLTGYQVGNCPVTVRPCVSSCGGPRTWLIASGGIPWHPFLRDGQWYNSCGCRPTDCSCSALTEIVLDGPVGAVNSVIVDGVTLDPATDYRVDNGNRLVRLAGPEWPTCQDMTANPSTPGSGAFSVTYVKGAVPDAIASFVAGILAKEYAEACSGNECRLPPSVTSLVRQGVSMEFGKDVFPDGRTGIDEVDVWIRYWNPYGVKMPASVFSPDVSSPRATTWTA